MHFVIGLVVIIAIVTFCLKFAAKEFATVCKVFGGFVLVCGGLLALAVIHEVRAQKVRMAEQAYADAHAYRTGTICDPGAVDCVPGCPPDAVNCHES